MRDVGTTISTETEKTRSSLVEVAKVNLKRLQEALRSLEEFGKFSMLAWGSCSNRCAIALTPWNGRSCWASKPIRCSSMSGYTFS